TRPLLRARASYRLPRRIEPRRADAAEERETAFALIAARENACLRLVRQRADLGQEVGGAHQIAVGVRTDDADPGPRAALRDRGFEAVRDTETVGSCGERRERNDRELQLAVAAQELEELGDERTRPHGINEREDVRRECRGVMAELRISDGASVAQATFD